MMAALAFASMTLGELLGPAADRHAGVVVSDLVVDSREVTPGAAFVALAGTTQHGLDHFEQAVARGAAIVLYDRDDAHRSAPEPSLCVPGLKRRLGEFAQRFFGRGRQAPDIAAVTGTNGKTTVAWLVASALTRRAGGCAYIGTLGYGVPPALTGQALTTPDCFTLHRELAAVGAPAAVLEVSSHALEQDRIAGLTMRIAAFTNLSRDHLDHHRDLETYGRVKASLFHRPGVERAVLNVGDPFAAELKHRLDAPVSAITVAAVPGVAADVVGRATGRGLAGLHLAIDGAYGAAVIESPLIGEFNAENLLVALGMLIAWQVPLADACAALAGCPAPPGRMDVVTAAKTGPAVVIDYAHTPAALERSLATVRSLSDGDVWCVFGCGGDRDKGKRAPMGAAAARVADHIVLTDDNPRSEDPARIVADISAGVAVHADLRVEHERAIAIRTAIESAGPGDVVLIAGKGHERMQLTADGARPFSDRDVATRALGGAG